MEEPQNNKKFINRLIIWISTILGAGFVPKFSGTLGSIIACVYFWFIPRIWLELSILLFTIISIYTCGRAEVLLGVKDPKPVIIDDFTGMLIALMPADGGFWEITLCFILFRVFDGLKVFPADILEKYPGALGILGDDVIAGIYAAGVFYSAKFLVNILK